MLVTIVIVPLPDNSGPDVSRMGTVEDVHPEIALKMLAGGTAREPSNAELQAYHDKQLAPPAEDAAPVSPVVDDFAAETEAAP